MSLLPVLDISGLADTGPDRPPKYRPVTAAAYLRERLDASYAHRRELKGADAGNR